MRRWLPTGCLAVVAVLAASVAVRSAAAAPPDAPSDGGNVTPVLSARRVPTLLSEVVADARLADAVDAVLAAPGVGPATARSCVVAEHGGRVVYERNPGLALIPASTLKVLTASAALAALGPDARITTEVRTVRPVQDGVVDGAVWLVGAGDPLLATAEYLASFRNQPQVATSMEALADAVVAAGVREIRGGVIGDHSRFDDQRYHPSWKPSYAAGGHVGPVDALVVNDGFLQFTPVRSATSDPPEHAAAVLSTLLEARGVVVRAPAGDGIVPAEAHRLASVASPTVAEMVGEMLRESDNNTAEVLTKELGVRLQGAGTWPAGVDALREVLRREGLRVDGVETVDGSGLDRGNRLTCAVLQDALRRGGDAIAQGLAVAGRTGTLADRFSGSPLVGRLRAKTGSLDRVVGLAGYVDARRGPPVRFSLLLNDLRRDATGRAVSERVAELFAAYPDAPAPARLAPLPPDRRG